MRNTLLLLFIAIGITVQAQFTPLVGIIASNEVETGLPADTNHYVFPDAINGWFQTNFDMQGLVNHTVIVYASLDNDAEENVFIGAEGDGGKYYFRRHSGGNIWITLTDNAGNTTATSRAWTYSSGYHQFAYTYSTTSGGQVFVDGVSLGGAVDNDFTGFDNGIQYSTIGRRNGNTSSQLDGKMKQYQIYNRELSDAEIGQVGSDLDNTPSGLVAWFREDKTSSIWTDNIAGKTATNKGALTLVAD